MINEVKNKKISVLGCGWLGLPMAKLLVKNGWEINGSTTTPAKLKLLEQAGIEPFLIDLESRNEPLNPAFFEVEFMLINIPPGRKSAPNGYLQKMEFLLENIRSSSIKKIIFISSTSVYHDVCREITEADEPENQSELRQTEMLFLSAKNLDTTIIRFGGLIGPQRNPGRFFMDKNSIPNGLVPVNLIHLNDCLGLIEAVLDQQKFPEIFNAVAPSHPTKQQFYGKAIEKMDLAAPEFVAEKTDWKMINPAKIISDLNYTFQYPDLLVCLDDTDAF